MDLAKLLGMDATTPRKVLALLRVSTKEQDMVRQRTDIQWHIDRFREDGILLEIEKEYALDGITGVVVQNTPEFKAMLDHLKQPHISGSSCLSLTDLCARNTLMLTAH